MLPIPHPPPAVLLRRHATAQEFLAVAQHWLERAESANNLLLSLASRRMATGPSDAGDFFVTVRDHHGLCLAAGGSNEGGLLLAATDPRALTKLARELACAGFRPQGVVAEVPVAERFAAIFCPQARAEAKLRHRLKHLALHTLPLPPVVPGTMRDATLLDLAPVEHWWTAFREETRTPGSARDLLEAVENRLPGRGVVLWCGPEPLAMAAYTLLQPNSARISAVFTAPTARRQGFASALVAALCRQLMLKGGEDGRPRRACFLSTDATNPVSNAIYERIGFRDAGEHLHLDFLYRPAA